IPRGVFAQIARKSRDIQRQNVMKSHFVCIAKRVAVNGVNSNQKAWEYRLFLRFFLDRANMGAHTIDNEKIVK
ncbi:MAG: hypothetical protein KH828_14235, partial [Clostridiales bacterium]|nr:hypothetical protein [Clostridiales bacterium]